MKAQISTTNKDSETGKVVEAAIFGLFAKEDIVSKNGIVIFVSDLPHEQHYVKELDAPKGYVKRDMKYDVDASYQGDKIDIIDSNSKLLKNEFQMVNHA